MTNGTSMSLSKLTDFKWDQVFIFHPYTPEDKIDQTLGFHWRNRVKGELEMNDRYNLMVFVCNGDVVQYARISKSEGNWTFPTTNGFARGQDLFRITKSDDGTIVSPANGP
jgi:hypothetical protein